MKQRLIANISPIAPKEATIVSGSTRLTVLTPNLIRVETSKSCSFCDDATQIVWYRDFSCPFCKDEDDNFITITTSAAAFRYNKKRKKVDYVTLGGKTIPADNKANLKGTARTLDMCFYKVKLEDGIIASNGVAVMQDDSLILLPDGTCAPRGKGKDIYIFASIQPIDALQSFFAITGKPPLIPRYALGNWWSRYYAYTADEYLTLMDKFAQEDIPYTVATIDMDWHWVKVKKQFGYRARCEKVYLTAGWTGYSWNTNLFPDYKAFLKGLHGRNLKTTLNLHPASGVRWFETQYGDMCRAMGLNPDSKQIVKFDITDKRFIEAYFEILHERYEDDGVDFWWMDWQQGKKTAIKGLDPLWALNHYHTLNSSRGNKKPLILSRYSGLGSHRYPIGFSGDTFVNWAVLRFQVYFTITASNAGYNFWSHDIGGHQFGRQKDDELYLRWIQFGVFSPILRLHSTSTALSKEPWNHPTVQDTAIRFLQLRHRLIPYLYIMCKRTEDDSRPLIEPMYYTVTQPQAYQYKHQYYFGTELIVAPVVSKSNKLTGLTATDIWLPQGNYTNIFTGEKLNGGQHTVYSTLESIPVFAKEGAIIPLSNDGGNTCGNPKSLELLIYAGNNSFTLYEDADDLSYKQGNLVTTQLEIRQDKGGTTFIIHPSKGNLELIPQVRTFTLNFADVGFTNAEAQANGEAISCTISAKNVIFDCKPSAGAVIILK